MKTDRPISKSADDIFNRVVLANQFVETVLSYDISTGLVVGIMGSWGSGKTSFVNIVKEVHEEKGCTVIEYNPWMFSSADQLLGTFFSEIVAELSTNEDYSDVVNYVINYSKILAAATWAPDKLRFVAGLIGGFDKTSSKSLRELKKDIEQALEQINKPIVVIIDDIDRLTSAEIREIFKMVRLTANFPNFIYYTVFDQRRVASALQDESADGYTYMEKIIQLPFLLPSLPEHLLNQVLVEELEQLLSETDNIERIDLDLWSNVFYRVILPMIANMRDVRRYVASARVALQHHSSTVAVTDILGLEAVRIFRPQIFDHLTRIIDPLTTTETGQADYNQQIKVFLSAFELQATEVSNIILTLFPAAGHYVKGAVYSDDFLLTWLKEKRVANKLVFQSYLEYSTSPRLDRVNTAERLVALFDDPLSFESELHCIDIVNVQDTLEAILIYTDKFKSIHANAIIPIISNILPRLPQQRQSFMSFSPKLTVSRLSVALLKRIDDVDQRSASIKHILNDISTLGVRLNLIDDIGYNKHGLKLVSEHVAEELQSQWLNQLAEANVHDLENDYDLFTVMLQYLAWSKQPLPSAILHSNSIVYSIMRGALRDVSTRKSGVSRVIWSRELYWDELITLFGSEDHIRKYVGQIDSSGIVQSEDALHLIKKYLNGWRPER